MEKFFYAIINSYNFLAHITNVVHAKNKYYLVCSTIAAIYYTCTKIYDVLTNIYNAVISLSREVKLTILNSKYNFCQ